MTNGKIKEEEVADLFREVRRQVESLGSCKIIYKHGDYKIYRMEVRGFYVYLEEEDYERTVLWIREKF